MFQLMKKVPNFDFMGKRNLWLGVSAVIVLASILLIAVKGVNRGIEFTGGTEMQFRFADTPNVGDVRSALGDAGLSNFVVTTIGDAASNEVYIKVGIDKEGNQVTGIVTETLRGGLAADTKDIDLNIIDAAAMDRLLAETPALAAGVSSDLSVVIADLRRELAIFHSYDELSSVPGMTPEILDSLREKSVLGPIAVRSQSYIGPAIGKELLRNSAGAVIGSLIGMLLYIWIRFQIQWGLAAVVALTHDTIVVLGLFSLFGQELSLPVVAAFLTLVGYSVNDTVVVFDRIRENLASKRAGSLEEVVNLSINQTLSRTIITSGLTWIVVFGLFLFGGSALRSFSFVLSVGVVVGTYSSIYIASPFLVVWKQFLDRRNTPSSRAGVAAT